MLDRTTVPRQSRMLVVAEYVQTKAMSPPERDRMNMRLCRWRMTAYSVAQPRVLRPHGKG